MVKSQGVGFVRKKNKGWQTRGLRNRRETGLCGRGRRGNKLYNATGVHETGVGARTAGRVLRRFLGESATWLAAQGAVRANGKSAEQRQHMSRLVFFSQSLAVNFATKLVAKNSTLLHRVHFFIFVRLFLFDFCLLLIVSFFVSVLDCSFEGFVNRLEECCAT